MTGPAYPAARVVAATIEAHLAAHRSAVEAQGQQTLAPHPDTGTIEQIINAAFWASLRQEEGHPPKISLAYLAAEHAQRPLRYERPLRLAPQVLAHLAPAVERPGIHLGVWPVDGELRVWGATRTIPPLALVLEVVQPGLLVAKYRRGPDSGKFGNLAVLEGDQVKVIDTRAADLTDCPPLLASLLGFGTLAAGDADEVDVLVQLAVSMRAHARGGSLLVVPDGAEAWRESIIQPISYAVRPGYAELTDLVRKATAPAASASGQEALGRAVDAVAGLTAVDGATVISSAFEVLAFGAKIGRRDGRGPVEQVRLTEPVRGRAPVELHPAQIGGTRHLSAAQFVHDQRDALALIASQDGRFTIFAWSPCEQMVHAHRVETLLM